MPRIAREPGEHQTEESKAAIEAWKKTGNGSSTWDVCTGCNSTLVDGDPWDEIADILTPYNGEPEMGDWIIMKDIEHPPYPNKLEEGETPTSDHKMYHCALCNKPLTTEDEE